MKNKTLQFIKFLIGWPISLIAIFYIFKFILPQSKSIITNLKEINFLLLSYGVIFFLIFYFIRCYLWKLILKEQGYDIPLKKASFLWEISELKRFAPGNIWSFIARSNLFFNQDIPAKTIAKSLAIEVEFFFLGCLSISLFSIYFIFGKAINIISYNPIMPFIGILIFIFISLPFIFSRRITKLKKFHLLEYILPDFPATKNILFLIISSLSIFSFGLGTYLSITSITYLSPELILHLIGFFAFSLLVGYLSFITPMGLGVREAILIVGLSKFLSLSASSFVAIFTRVILILSEIIFLFLVTLFEKIKNKFLHNLEVFVSKYKHELILSFFILLYISYFMSASFLKYDNFYTGRFDLGNMDQTVWNTIHGRIFQLTDPNGTNTISRLAFHADFILILLAPFYILWSDPKMLLLIQTIILGFGALFVYLISKNILKNNNLSLVFAVIFLFNPAVELTNLYDFHPVALATTFLLAAFYFLIKNKHFLLVIFLVLAGITKEQIWIIAGIFGLYLAIFRRDKINKILGALIALTSFSIFYYLVWHAIPNALGKEHFALSYYSDFGDTPTHIIKNVLLSPQKILSTVFQGSQLNYVTELFAPIGFVSIFSPLYLIFSIPSLGINLLSNNSQLHQIYYQYSAAITPFVFISAIYGIKNLQKWFPKVSTEFYIFYLISTTLISSFLFGPLPGTKKPAINMFTQPLRNKEIIDKFLKQIPTRFTIASTNNLGSHLSRRRNIFTIPVGVDQGHVVAFLLNDSFAQPSLDAQRKMVKKLELDKNYIELFKLDDFVAFQKLNFVRKRR